MNELTSLLQKDYQGVTRRINNTKSGRLTTHGIWPQQTFDHVSPKHDFPLKEKVFNRLSALHMSHFFSFIINNVKGQEVSIAVESSDACLSTSVYEGIYQFISADRNHETYTLETQFLKPVNKKIQTEPDINKQVVVKVDVTESCKAGAKQLLFSYKYGNMSKTFQAKIDVIAKKLAPLKIPVGFLGLSPVHYSYYPKSDEVLSDQQYWRLRALEMLEARGFTLLNDFPEETLQRTNLLQTAKRRGFQSILTYGHNDWVHKLISENRELRTVFNVDPITVFAFSDEAGGYQDRLEQDIAYAKEIKTKYPFLLIGGFTMMNKNHRKLNKLFDVGLYSNYLSTEVNYLKKWGFYNLSSKPLDNPRYVFGVGLYYFEQMGISILAEWNAGAVHNYPYFDLDGRENDAVMFYPTTSGELLPSIKLEQAYQGVLDYKLLKLLNPKVANRISRTIKPSFNKKTGFLVTPSRSSSLMNELRKEVLERVRP